MAIFDAIEVFAPALAARCQLPISQRTKVRIKSADEKIKYSSFEEIESKLVELTRITFPRIGSMEGMANKYVDEYFRLWGEAAKWAPRSLKNLDCDSGETAVLGRAFVRDILLRLLYLESCERQLNGRTFAESELKILQHDCPKQVYRALISLQVQSKKITQEKLSKDLGSYEKKLGRVKKGETIPNLQFLSRLKDQNTDMRMLAGIGFIDQLLKTLELQKSNVRNEFLPIASTFFRHHPKYLETFKGSISSEIESEACDFENFVKFGENLLLHPEFDRLWSDMPDALWRCHLYTLRHARIFDLALAYLRFSTVADDQSLEGILDEAEQQSGGSRHAWMNQIMRSDPGKGSS